MAKFPFKGFSYLSPVFVPETNIFYEYKFPLKMIIGKFQPVI